MQEHSMHVNHIEIFKSPEGRPELHVRLVDNSIWLTQSQIVELFDSSKANISEHIKHIFQSGELDEGSTVRNFRTVQKEGTRQVERDRIHYNLDVIISVGYRVNSIRGTQFRQWATQRLNDFLIRGVAVNNQRLEQLGKNVEVLKSGIRILSRVIEEKSEGSALDWLAEFSSGLTLLDDYDNENLDKKGLTHSNIEYPELNSYYELIKSMKTEFNSPVFGIEKDKGFESAIRQIEKGMDNQDFYPSAEEKAAVLLYLITKNHAFTDGNKRIAAACFLLFIKTNNLLYNQNGHKSISDDALAALTLFTAASKPEEMETVIRLILSVLNRSAIKNG
jgi:prophage maintenance system killer protein